MFNRKYAERKRSDSSESRTRSKNSRRSNNLDEYADIGTYCIALDSIKFHPMELHSNGDTITILTVLEWKTFQEKSKS